ncbi:MAG TPA: galactokinase [Firmicutes bacterium]|nr:galactokinase [Candidatus Fermentithermobacillaceae bacterium]
MSEMVFFAPGRVNLIGEHTDYNGGFVFPAAISLGIYATVKYTAPPDDPSRIIRVRSENAPGEGVLKPGELEGPDLAFGSAACAGGAPSMVVSRSAGGRAAGEKTCSDSWVRYVEGVVRFLLAEGLPVPGCDIAYSATLPVGAGLSSSAALELVTAYALTYPFMGELGEAERVRLAKLCQKAENEFVGVGCGLMDQFSVAMGKKDKAILLDCASLEWSYVPADLGEYSLVIMDTRKQRNLGESGYNRRREECRQALEIIRKHKDIAYLCQANPADLDCIQDEVLFRRARHVVSENQRVLEAARRLEAGQLEGFGALMVESHESLRRDFEVTGPELDAMVDAALGFPACAGARMTGAGFGGCAIALVRSESVEEFTVKVSDIYREKTHVVPTFYAASIQDGVMYLGTRV